MTVETLTIIEEINLGQPNRQADLAREVTLGHVLARLVRASAADESALNPALGSPVNTLALAAIPAAVLHVQAVAGAGTLGPLELVIGLEDKITVAPGQVLWVRGSSRLRFNAADAWTSISVWYTEAADTMSLFDRALGQQD